jgi:hypothetical protein
MEMYLNLIAPVYRSKENDDRFITRRNIDMLPYRYRMILMAMQHERYTMSPEDQTHMFMYKPSISITLPLNTIDSFVYNPYVFSCLFSDNTTELIDLTNRLGYNIAFYSPVLLRKVNIMIERLPMNERALLCPYHLIPHLYLRRLDLIINKDVSIEIPSIPTEYISKLTSQSINIIKRVLLRRDLSISLYYLYVNSGYNYLKSSVVQSMLTTKKMKELSRKIKVNELTHDIVHHLINRIDQKGLIPSLCRSMFSSNVNYNLSALSRIDLSDSHKALN